jgi:ABC-2 type transport system ATP-binding protein
MEDIIIVDRLNKNYGDFTAVQDVSFSVKEGEIFGILGPNGAGKTTTLEMIEGLKRPTSGNIIVGGFDAVANSAKVKAIIGVQLQSSSFFDNLNLKELVDIFAAMYGREVDAMELLAAVGLTDKAKNQVKELSGGQKQRLSIAVALVNDPKVIFLDEPTTGLDPQARRNLWELIKKINQEGKTIVLTTHYLEEAEILCDRIAIMDNSHIIALDTTRNLITETGITPSIVFESDSKLEEHQLKLLPAVQQVEVDFPRYRLISTSPQLTLPALFSIYGRDVLDLQLKQPTLEDVFLKLTGHALRD